MIKIRKENNEVLYSEEEYISINQENIEWLKDQLPYKLIVASKGDLTDNCLRALSGEKKTADGLSLSGSAIPFHITKENGKRGMGIRQCTVAYKIETIMKVVRKELGYEKGQRVKKNVNVEMLLGISQDEVYRVKESRYHYVTHEYPLIDKKLSRQDCLKWMKNFNYPVPQRSACYYCPYHSDSYWLPVENYGQKIDVMLECKLKEHGLFKMRELLQEKGSQG